MSPVGALVLTGVFPAFGVLLAVARDRRVDVFGVLVLVGIAVGTVLGLGVRDRPIGAARGLSADPAVFGAVCIASLWTAPPADVPIRH